MYIYKVNEDGVSCAYKVGSEGDGWLSVPQHLEGENLYLVDGKLTNQKPEGWSPPDNDEAKIQRKMREIAIKELIKDGVLPPDYKE